MTKFCLLSVLIITSFIFGDFFLNAQVHLPDIFGDHMVFQQQQSIPIWGKADPGEMITIVFRNQQKEISADQEGDWKVSLDPMPASSEPGELIIKASNKIVMEDILIGEVWLCSGQSNMQWTIQQSDHAKETIEQAQHPQIRLFNVSRDVGFKRQEGKLASWELCSPTSVESFSGVGYFFGKQIF